MYYEITYEAKQWLGTFRDATKGSKFEMYSPSLQDPLSLAGLQSPVSQKSRVCHVRLSAALCWSWGARCDGPEYRLQSVSSAARDVTATAVRAQPPPSRLTLCTTVE